MFLRTQSSRHSAAAWAPRTEPPAWGTHTGAEVSLTLWPCLAVQISYFFIAEDVDKEHLFFLMKGWRKYTKKMVKIHHREITTFSTLMFIILVFKNSDTDTAIYFLYKNRIILQFFIMTLFQSINDCGYFPTNIS